MVLAAGLGTRLRPLTNDRPKALVTVAGRTLLEITLERLRSFGVRDVIINVHHFAEALVEYLESHDNFGMNLEISQEESLLDTGGGLKKAANFFLGNSDSSQSFILHNVDVISTIDLFKMLEFHEEQQALVTLATQHRKTSRHLLFDEKLRLCGRQTGSKSPEMIHGVAAPDAVGFCGIQIISPSLLRKMTETGVFSIIDTYLRIAATGERVLSFSADEYYWRDLGNPKSIAGAETDIAKGLYS
jgi:NDP-sugar pyrophosphorylase family protein